MCCNGECPYTKSRCRCDCTRCRHCGKCGHQDGPGVGLLIAGVVGALAVATAAEKTSRRRPWEEEVTRKRHLARRIWESTETESEYEQTPDYDREGEVFYTDSNGNYAAGPSACKPSFRRQRQVSTCSTASAASQVSISSIESQSSRTNRRSATMRRRSSTARSSASVNNDCTIL